VVEKFIKMVQPINHTAISYSVLLIKNLQTLGTTKTKYVKLLLVHFCCNKLFLG